MGNEKCMNNLVIRLQGMSALERQMSKWENNIETGLRKIGCEDLN
jgi:hypothetical protein